MSDQLALPTAHAVETFVASLRQRALPLNTIKSYAHDLRLFVQAVPADLTVVTPEQIQTFLTSDEHHSAVGPVLAARHLERAMTEMKMRMAALEVPDDRTHE